jgi:hypothetical protein
MKLEELQEKIEQFLELNEEFIEIGMCDITHDTGRRYLQAMAEPLVALAKQLNVELIVKKRDCKDFPIDISIPALKMYAICTIKHWAELKKTLPWRGLKDEVDGDPDA